MGIFCFLGGGQIVSTGGTWGDELWSGLQPILAAIFTVLGVVAVGYSVFLGFLLAKAENEEKRKQAKSRIFKTISGLFIIVILVSSMTIPGADGKTFLSSILTGTTDRTHYRLGQINFSISEVSDGRNKMLVLFKDGYETSVGVEYVQLQNAGTPGVRVTEAGMVTATAAGNAVIDVKVNGNVILSEVPIIIRAINEAPPPPAGQITSPDGDPGPGPGAPDEAYDLETLKKIRELAESFLGKSGYTQSTVAAPTRNTVTYMSHYMEGGVQKPATIRYFDCSSFTNFIFGSVLGITLGNSSSQLEYMRTKNYVVNNPQPGDWFHWDGHVGIYMGDIGPVKRFGTFGDTYNNGNIIIHCGGATGTGNGFFWSNYKTDGTIDNNNTTTYRQGVTYSQVYKRGDSFYNASTGGKKLTFARPFRYV